MDPTVPAGAARLLDFIGGIEAPRGYDTIYGNNQGKLAKPVTSMTLAEVQSAQASWTKRFGSSATGRYQFMKATLAGLIAELKLSTSQKLDANLQDRLGYHLLKRRGYEAFVAGKISAAEFGKRLAQEWASLPVLADTQGAHRRVKRGQSYYAGDGLNKSLVKPEKVEAVLAEVYDLGYLPQKPTIPTTPGIIVPDAKPEPRNRLLAWLIDALSAFANLFSRKEK
jgi:muramidase (phage lysozyme)